MTDAEHLVAMVRDGRVRVSADRRLPRLDPAAGWPYLAELQVLSNDLAPTLLAPTWQLGAPGESSAGGEANGEPDPAPSEADTEQAKPAERFLHLLWTPEAAGELCAAEAIAEAPEVRAAVLTALREWNDAAARPPLRPDWYAPGWRAEIEDWIDTALAGHGRRRTGPAELIRMWTLSTVLRLPTEDGSVYLKATCQHFAGEPAITALLSERSPGLVPDILAVEPDRSWMLMNPLPGEHPRPRDAADAPPTAAALARLQADLADSCDALLAVGAVDRRLEPTVAALDQVLTDSVEADQLTADERAVAARLGPWLTDILGELAECGLPYSISHGDLHTGNIARDGDRLVVYDWTDAAVSFPTLDVSLLVTSSGDELAESIWAAYAAGWQSAGVEVDFSPLIELSRIGCLAYQAISYEQIFRSSEPRVRWEMAGGVSSRIRRLVKSWPGRP